jgi:phage gpG-like protein
MLEIDFGSAMAELDALLARLMDPAPLLEAIGAATVEHARDNITSLKLDPEGEQWAPWMPRTAAARRRKGNASQGLLWDTGTLLDSIHADVAGDLLTVGTPVSYAGYLQGGTEKMVARPFLGWSEDALAFAETMAADYLAGALA